MVRPTAVAFSALFLFVAATPAVAADGEYALVGATVFDGTGADPVPDAVVLVRDGRIVAVGPRESVEIPTGIRIEDVSGKWIVPGLIDAHVHFFQSGGLYTRPDMWDLRERRPYETELETLKANLDDTFHRVLASGVTAVVDVGGPLWNFEVRNKARSTPMAPRVAVAGPLIATRTLEKLDLGDPPIIKASTPEEARRLVREQLKRAPDLIKILGIGSTKAKLRKNLPIAAAAIDEAHKGGCRVAVHATHLEAARAAVRAGADILVHSVEDVPVDAAFVRLLEAKGTLYTPTLLVIDRYGEIPAQGVQLIDIEKRLVAPGIRDSWPEVLAAPAGALPPEATAGFAEWIETHRPIIRRNLQRLSRAGIPVAAGTDAGNPGTLHGPSLHRELELMVEAGLTPRQALLAATRDAAKVFAREPKIGTLQPGHHADLLVLDADPLVDVRNLQKIHRVIKAGQSYEPDAIVSPSPSTVVQRQVDAFNARDIEAFAATYAEDVVITELPAGKLHLKGREALRERFSKLFAAKPEQRAVILSRKIQGKWVIDDELILDGTGKVMIRGLAIYEVRDGLIQTVWFPM